MTVPEATEPPQAASLAASMGHIRTFALALAGGLVISGAVIGAFQHAHGDVRTIGLTLVAAALWGIAWVPSMRAHRAVVQIALMLALMASPLLFGADATFGRLTTAGSICVAAVLALPMRTGIPVAALTIGLNTLLEEHGTADIARGSLMPGWASTVILVAVTVSCLTQRREWERDAIEIDRMHTSSRDRYTRERQLIETTAVRGAIDRRIHETVLNTLTEISVADAPDPDVIAHACADDLARLDELPDLAAATTLSAILATGIAQAHETGLVCELDLGTDVLLPPLQANVLRDAVIESLRNIRRHAQTDHARIEANGGETVVVRISDDGVGIDPSQTPRLGTRIALRSSLAIIGGETTIAANEPHGSVVTITMPSGTATHAPRSRDVQSVGNPQRSLSFWLGVAAPAMTGAILAAPVARLLDGSWPVALAMIAVSSTAVAVALSRSPRASRVASVVTALTILVLLAVVAFAADGCSTGDATRYALIVALLAIPATARGWSSYLPMLTIALAVAAATAWVALASPAACGGWIAGALVPVAGFSVGNIAIYWLNDRYIDGIARQDDAWLHAFEQRIAVARAEAAADGWRQVDPTTRELLRGIAERRLALDAPAVRTAVEVEATLLRTRIELTATEPSAARELVSQLADEAIAARTGMDAQVLNEIGRTQPIPAAVTHALRQLMREAHGSPVRVRAFNDAVDSENVLVSAARQHWDRCLDRLWLRPVDGATAIVEDCRVEVFVDDETLSVLLTWPRPGTGTHPAPGGTLAYTR